MHIKPKDPRSFVTPAPGAYNPESADRDVKPMAPRYSFGIKGKDEKPISIPGEGKTEKRQRCDERNKHELINIP